MPGIFGVVDPSTPTTDAKQRELKDIARRMSAAMTYEPFYACATIFCSRAGAYVGRVGLAHGGATANSESTSDERIVAITTGDDLTRDDAVDLTDRLLGSGIRSGFVADNDARRCMLFNDKYGRERLFVYVASTRVFFASEAKAILAVAPETRAFDANGLAELLSCGCTLGKQSLFRNIEVLDPGTLMTIESSRVSRRQYFDPSSLEQLPAVSGREFADGFPNSLRSAVSAHIEGGPRVAMSLTGGLDSRMVMAVVDAPSGHVPTYTFGSMYRTTADVAVARAVAERCGQPHNVIELGNSFLARFPETFEEAIYISDGYLGLSAAAELHVNRLARAIAPGRMTGNWGGELMRGVRAFKASTPKGGFITPELETCLRACAEALDSSSSHPMSAALFQQMPFQGYGRNAIERSQLVMRHPFLADEVVEWLYRAPAAIRQSMAAASTVIGHRPELLSIPTDRGLLGARPSRLRRASRGMLVKAEYLTSHGAPDWVARLSARLPSLLLERRFLGVDKFQHFRFWTRRNLAGFVRDTLVRANNGELDQWFDMRRVKAMAEHHIAGRANYTDEIDKLLTLTVAQKMLFAESTRKAA
jgi:asparagine synthase (glutamine-hydrolysing)